jgi:DNA polymerase-4
MAVILHADMDEFYAAIEQRDRPELRGRPVIVGGDGPRQVVCTASYEAREYGVHSALPGTVARHRCPQGIFVAPRMEHYARESAAIFELFKRYTPLVEPLSLDEAFLDVTGSQALFGTGEEIAGKLKRDVAENTGLCVSVGVAACKFVAKVASDLDKPDGLVVVAEGGESAFLAPLPVSRLWGAGPAVQQRCRGLGLETIGDMQGLEQAELQRAFGSAAGGHFHRLCRGLDPREVVPDREARSVSHEQTFAEDLQTWDACRSVLLKQSEQVGRRLRRGGLRAWTVRLKARYPDFTTFSRQSRLTVPVDDDLAIYRTADQLLAGLWTGVPGIRLLGVGVADLVSAGGQRQIGLFESDTGKSAKLLKAMDSIRDRFGDDAIRHGGAG